ncbi:MAG: HK97 gp10 family phage protein [Lactobacillus sp.]|jgi:hypothetical protein|nr:HK97 gp10 family phage protein [Lactobacillus sp.]MCH4067960.1 HK97 gp10 family phage protein [Lactobacillus sp.]MCI1303601.1 HK97 gp10 family phage protein [Lactobacillus sp.]MCI1329890.1 HK97 gp10 family phage protein [Lactobacillus sp.]MCI1399490.1 HK97 gp10 family phage protein [Lactobacillus sp.]
MASLEEQLEAFRKRVAACVPNKEQQQKATEAGAKYFAQELSKITKEKHYSNKKDAKYGHMADHISFHAGNGDGVMDGSSTVGWTNRYHAMNAMRLNDGTVHIKADHFVDNAREDCMQGVLEAEAKALKGDAD